MKKSLKVALAAVCLIAAGAFFIGCANPNGGETGSGSGSGSSSGSSGTGGSGSGSGYAPKYAVGDIVLNDGTKVAYSVAKDYSDDSQELKDLKKNAIAVIFRADTENKPALGVGIKHERGNEKTTFGLAWCISDAAGYDFKFSDTFCEPDEGTSAPNLTFKNSPNADGSKNLGKMVLQMQNEGKDDTEFSVFTSGKLILFDKIKLPSQYINFKNKYPAFEFAYYYGLNYGHNITSGSDFENGWYLPSLSELNDIFQANKKDNVIENALGVTGGDKFDGSQYWSSSQEDDGFGNKYIWVYYLNLYSGQADSITKDTSDLYACAIRAFN